MNEKKSIDYYNDDTIKTFNVSIIIISFNRQQLLLFGLIYLLDRVISAYTEGVFSETLDAIDQKVYKSR